MGLGLPVRALLVTGAMALAPAACGAAVPDQARTIIEHYVAATGGRDALEAPRLIHVKGRLRSMNMTGTFEQWAQPPDRFLSVVRLGSLRVRSGFDGEVGWSTDLTSKQVTILDGKDLEALRSDAYFENEMWARRDPGKVAFRVGSVSYAGDAPRCAILVTPPVGPPRTLWFNLETGLVERIVRSRDHRQSSEWVARYRTVGGRLLPTYTGPAAPDEEMVDDPDALLEGAIVDSSWVDEPLPASFYAPPEARAPVAWIRAEGRLPVPFRYGGRHVWIRASVNGAAPADFILDTGASITVLDRGFAQSIGLAGEGIMEATGVTGSDEGAFVRLESLRISRKEGGAVAVRDLRAAVVDLSGNLSAVMWRKPAGLIGSDFLSRFVVEIDYDGRTVTFHEPKGYVHGGPAAPIPMGLASGVPTVEATLDDDCSGTFLVDVGNGFEILIHGSAVRRCRLFGSLDQRRKVEVYSGGIGGAALNWVCRLERIRLGEVEVAEPVVALGLATRGIMGSQDHAGNIGSRFLEHFRCTFDYGRRRLYLDPGDRSAERPGFSRSGVFLAKFGEKVVPGHIVRGSAADKAGLRLGDEVQAIDGRPAGSLGPEDLDRILLDGEEGTKHTLTVLRDGRPKTITIELREML